MMINKKSTVRKGGMQHTSCTIMMMMIIITRIITTWSLDLKIHHEKKGMNMNGVKKE